MSFTIILKTNNSRDNARNKNTTDIVTLTGTLREGSSIVDPSILIEYSGNLASCNYAEISEFGRAYFVRNIEHVRNNIYQISMHCDVLSSAGSNFDNCTGIVRRQEYINNGYLDDGVIKSYNNPIVVTKSFPGGFTTETLTLAVAGS